MEIEITEDRFIEFMSMDFPSLKITKSNLSYPTSDFVTSFYSLMIEAMTGINNADQLCNLTNEQYTQLKANQNEGSSIMQLVYLRNLHSAVKYIFSQLSPNVPEFNFSDILMPENTPRRTFLFMSFMLNCFYYFSNFSEELDDEMIACQEKGKEIRSMNDLKSQLINQLKEKELEKMDYAESLKNYRANILKYKSLNKEKENILKELYKKHDLLNTDCKKLEERERNIQDKLIKFQNDVKHYESLIVSNPDEAAEIHAQKKIKMAKCKEQLKNLQEKVETCKAKLSRFNKLIDLQNILNNIILEQDNHSPDMIKKDFKELQKCINNLNGKLLNLKNSASGIIAKFIDKELIVPKLKDESAQYDSEEAAIVCKGNERCRRYEEYIENQDKVYSQMNIKIRKDEEEVEEISARIADLNVECNKKEQKIKELQKEVKETYNLCIKEINDAFNSIRSSLNK